MMQKKVNLCDTTITAVDTARGEEDVGLHDKAIRAADLGIPLTEGGKDDSTGKAVKTTSGSSSGTDETPDETDKMEGITKKANEKKKAKAGGKKLKPPTKTRPATRARLQSQLRNKNNTAKPNKPKHMEDGDCSVCATTGKPQAKPARPARGRGRPKKQSTVENEKAPHDLRSLLMEIKGDVNDVNEQITDVKKQQKVGNYDFCNVMDLKSQEKYQ